MSFFILFLSLLIQSTPLVANAANCSDLYDSVGAYFYQRLQGQTHCQILVSPALGGTDYYRAAVFNDDGKFLVFNSYEYNKSTDGSRVFYFFPRTRLPSFEKQANGLMTVQTSAPGVMFVYDKTKPRYAGMVGGSLKEDPNVNPNNNGGIELRDVKTLWLDAGFKFKGDPTSDPNRKSVFVDLNGARCEVSNKEIFNVKANEDVFFKMSDVDLKNFLGKRCPRLQINF